MDTTKICIDRHDALNVLTKAASADLLRQKIDLFSQDIATLTKRIAEKDGTIKDLNDKDANNKSIIQGLNEQKKIMQDQRAVLLQEKESLDKQLRKAQRKTKWAAFSGLAASTIALILYLLK